MITGTRTNDVNKRSKKDANKLALVHEWICPNAEDIKAEDIMPKLQKAYLEHGLSAGVYVTIMQYTDLSGNGKPVIQNVLLKDVYDQIINMQKCEANNEVLGLEIYARCLKHNEKAKRLVALGPAGDAGKLFSYKVIFASKISSAKLGEFRNAIPFKKQTFADKNPYVAIDGYSKKEELGV